MFLRHGWMGHGDLQENGYIVANVKKALRRNYQRHNEHEYRQHGKQPYPFWESWATSAEHEQPWSPLNPLHPRLAAHAMLTAQYHDSRELYIGIEG